MDRLTAFFNDQFGLLPWQRPAELVLFATVFAATVAGVMGVAAFARPAKPKRRRLAEDPAGDAAAPTLHRENAAWRRLVKPLERFLGSEDKERRSTLRVRLMRAGFFAPGAVAVYHLARAVLAVVLGVVALVGLPLAGRGPGDPAFLPGLLAALAAGFYLPSVWLDLRIAERARQMRLAFPDALDLLLVCVEAGLGIDAALARVGDEMAGIHPVLAQQFSMVGLELRAGRSREDALVALGERIGLEEVSTFVSLLVQSVRLGTSLGDAVRVGADEMRTNRMLRAERKAHQLPVKLSIPLVLFLLPGLMIVIMLPPAIQFMRTMGPGMGAS